MSFRLKTIIGVGIIETILLIILVGSSLKFLKSSTEEELHKRARTTAQLFATTTKNAVLSSDLASLESFVNEVLTNDGVVYAKVFDQDQVLVEGGDKKYLQKKFVEDTNYESVTDNIFDTYANITEEGETFGKVQVGISVSFLRKTYNKAVKQAFIIAALELILSAVFSFILGSVLTRRLSKLKDATSIVAGGNYQHQISVTGNDELSEVSNSFNTMVQNLNESKKSEEIARDKLSQLNDSLEATVKRRTEALSIKTNDLENALSLLEIEKQKQVESAYKSGIAENAVSVLHNIGNVITPIVVQTSMLQDAKEIMSTARYLEKIKQLLEEQLSQNNLNQFLSSDPKGTQVFPAIDELINNLKHLEEKQKKSLLDIQRHLSDISDIISSQQKYANFKAANVEYNIVELIEDAIKLKGDLISKSDIDVSISHSSDLKEMSGDRNKLMQVILNFITNSIESIMEHMQKDSQIKGKINIDIKSHSSDFYSLTIIDNGSGANEESLEKAFKFGYSTKSRGSGFGLHDCGNFVLANKGVITLESDGRYKGAKIYMEFPYKMT